MENSSFTKNDMQTCQNKMLTELPTKKISGQYATEGCPIIMQSTKDNPEKWDTIDIGKNAILTYFPMFMSQALVRDLPYSNSGGTIRQPIQSDLDTTLTNTFGMYSIVSMAFGIGGANGVGTADTPYGRQNLNNTVLIKPVSNQYFVDPNTSQRMITGNMGYHPTNIIDLIVTLDYNDGTSIASPINEMGFVYGSICNAGPDAITLTSTYTIGTYGNLFNYFNNFSVLKNSNIRLSFGWRILL